MLEDILSITGRGGLYKLVSQGNGNVIVENIAAVPADRHRIAVGRREQISSLAQIAIYTDEEEKPLEDVMKNIHTISEGKPIDIDIKNASRVELEETLAAYLPDFDRERVHASDIRKLFTWYNLLLQAGLFAE